MVKVSKEYPKRLVMDADTLYKSCVALKMKYSFAKKHHGFTSLDKEQNEFKIKETSTNPDKIFTVLDEHSKKLLEFGARYEKYSLQILSKLEVAIPEGYKHIFTLLNTDEEHKKDVDVRLKTSKRMNKAHYNTTMAADSKGKAEDSIMCIFIGNEQNGNGKSRLTYK